jgi:hypothetical protein
LQIQQRNFYHGGILAHTKTVQQRARRNKANRNVVPVRR